MNSYKALNMTIIHSLLFLLVFCTEKSDVADDDSRSENANVISVTTSGQSGAYTFSVGINSPDKGCDQYADWWEVISVDEKLLYRRILGHSHVDEQPFTRTGGPVAVDMDEVVWIRAHLNNIGYGGDTFKGSVSDGFVKTTMPEAFADTLETQDPQPGKCPF